MSIFQVVHQYECYQKRIRLSLNKSLRGTVILQTRNLIGVINHYRAFCTKEKVLTGRKRNLGHAQASQSKKGPEQASKKEYSVRSGWFILALDRLAFTFCISEK